jgi:nitrite reductase (NADH) small subunit
LNETKTWVRAARCSDIPLREGRAVQVGNRAIAIFNLGDRYLAVENRCPHKAGPLADGIVSGSTVVCPLHAWKFSLETGEGVSGPGALTCVETFRTRVEYGIVLLEFTDREPHGVPGQELRALCVQPGENAAMTPCPSAAEA